MSNPRKKITDRKHLGPLVYVGIIGILFPAACFYMVSWICDDALITVRCIVNTLSSRGISWEPGLRSFAFTDPLWFLLHTLLGYISSEIYANLIISGIVFSTAAIAIPVVFASINRKTEHNSTHHPFITYLMIGAVVLSLTLCRSIAEFATSGLENSLSWLILSLIFLSQNSQFASERRQVSYVNDAYTTRILWLRITLISLLLLNRYDHIFLAAPFIYSDGVQIFRHIFSRREHQVRRLSKHCIVLITALSPLIIWLLFSTYYFGSFLPNPFFAKLMSGHSLAEYTEKGLYYLRDTSIHDPATAILMTAGLLGSICLSKSKTAKYLSIGSVSYTVYIITTGGDFMQGRMFSTPAFCAFLILIDVILHRQMSLNRNRLRSSLLIAVPICCLLVGAKNHPLFRDTVDQSEVFRRSGIVNEHTYWYKIFGWRSPTRSFPPLKPFAGKKTGVQSRCGAIGRFGMLMQAPFWLDTCGLVDPFIARIPPILVPTWRIGHLVRFIPKGYPQALMRNNPSLVRDPDLRSLLTQLDVLRRKPSKNRKQSFRERWDAIRWLHVGYWSLRKKTSKRYQSPNYFTWLPKRTLHIHGYDLFSHPVRGGKSNSPSSYGNLKKAKRIFIFPENESSSKQLIIQNVSCETYHPITIQYVRMSQQFQTRKKQVIPTVTPRKSSRNHCDMTVNWNFPEAEFDEYRIKTIRLARDHIKGFYVDTSFSMTLK